MKNGGDGHDILWDGHDNVRNTDIYHDNDKCYSEIASYYYW